jgi:hypothetical protein
MAILRAIFRAAIPDFLRKGFSANAMIREARSWGVSYRRTDMLNDVREFMGRFVNEERVKSLARNEIPRPWHMTEVDFRRLRNYRVWGDAEYYNPLTGQTSTQLISFYDDELRTEEEWEAEFAKQKEEAQYKTGIEFVSFNMRYLEHNKGMPY